MKRLIQSNCFKMLMSMQCKAEQHGSLIDECVDEVIKLSNSADSMEAIFRTLSYTRFRIHSLYKESYKATEFEKKCDRAFVCY